MATVSKHDYMKQTSMDLSLICPICTDPLQQPVSTVCIHIFCRRCIEPWLMKYSKSCPICRYPVTRENLIPINKNIGNSKYSRQENQSIKDEQTGLKQVTSTYRNPELEQRIARCISKGTVCLSEQNLTDDDMHIVVQHAIIDKKCRNLYLTQNQIGPHGISILANAFYGNLSLVELSLNNNQVSDSGVEYLVSALLLHGTCLRVLCLSNNHLTDESAQYLAILLETNHRLTRLWLSGNQIGDRGVQLLVDPLTHRNTHLEVLSLSSNLSVTDSSVDALVNMLKHNKSLKCFYMNSSGLSIEAIAALKAITVKRQTKITVDW